MTVRVTKTDAGWSVVNGSGDVLGTYKTNRQAWRAIDNAETRAAWARTDTALRCGAISIDEDKIK